MEKKVKYDYAFKLECVLSVVDEHRSCISVAKQKGIDESNIRNWVIFYTKYGKEGLFPKKNKVYSAAFKQKVLKSMDKDSLSSRGACVKFNIPSPSTILKWQKDFTNFGLEGLQPKPKVKSKAMNNFKRKKRKSDKPLTREEELLLENEALRCKIELQKKFHALVQTEERNKKLKP